MGERMCLWGCKVWHGDEKDAGMLLYLTLPTVTQIEENMGKNEPLFVRWEKMFVERPWQNSFSTLIFYSILERGVCSRGDCNVGLLAGALKNKLLNGENPIVLQAIGPRAQLRSLKAANAAGLMRNAANFRRLHGVVAWWSPTFNYRTFHAECIFFRPRLIDEPQQIVPFLEG